MAIFHEKDNRSPIRTFAGDIKAAQAKQGGITKTIAPTQTPPPVPTVPKTEPTKSEDQKTSDVPPVIEKKDNTVKKPVLTTPTKKLERNAADYLNQSKPENKTVEKSEPTLKTKKAITIPKQSLDGEVQKIAALAGKLVLEGDEGSVDLDNMSDGTIVQDKKVRRHRILPSIFNATKDWAEDTKDAIEEAQKPEFTVESPEKRADTIKAAAQNSKRVPKEDYDVVIKKFKNVERKSLNSAIQLKDKSSVKKQDAAWSSDENEAEKEDQQSEVTPVVEPAKTQPQEVVAPIKNETAVNEVEQETVPLPKVGNVPASPATNVSKAEVSNNTEVNRTEQSTASANTTKEENKFSIKNIPIYAIVITVVVVCLIGITTSLVFIFQSNSESEVAYEEPVTVSPFGNNTVDSTFTTNKDALIRTLSTKSIRGEGIRSVRFVNKEGDTVPSLNAGQVILEASGNKLLERSVSSIEFGFTTESSPFIVLTGANFDTAFAAMLNWEETLSSDIAPLFGENNTRKFIDAAYGVKGNQTARVLLGQNNEPQMAYVVLSSGAIIISTNLVQIAIIEGLLDNQQ